MRAGPNHAANRRPERPAAPRHFEKIRVSSPWLPLAWPKLRVEELGLLRLLRSPRRVQHTARPQLCDRAYPQPGSALGEIWFCAVDRSDGATGGAMAGLGRAPAAPDCPAQPTPSTPGATFLPRTPTAPASWCAARLPRSQRQGWSGASTSAATRPAVATRAVGDSGLLDSWLTAPQ